jgi:hypothetical protein
MHVFLTLILSVQSIQISARGSVRDVLLQLAHSGELAQVRRRLAPLLRQDPLRTRRARCGEKPCLTYEDFWARYVF